MGVFDWPLRVSSLNGEHSLDVEATVDTGASYTVLPTGMLEQLGVVATRKLTFELADGRRRVMDVGSSSGHDRRHHRGNPRRFRCGPHGRASGRGHSADTGISRRLLEGKAYTRGNPSLLACSVHDTDPSGGFPQ